jgi:hypothetical protein
LSNSTVSGNSTAGDYAYGGGIVANISTLTNSTVNGNSTAGDGAIGGGIRSYNSATLTNSTVSGNVAKERGGGVGFSSVFANGHSLTIQNSIIAGNSDNGAAPDFTATGNLTVQNSIIGSTLGTGLPAGNNNQLNVHFTAVLETEVVNGVTVPLLTDNGGPVETIALLANSPAIDAGDNNLAVDANGNPLTTDQRGAGFDRIFGATVDIGAFEFAPSTFLLGDVNQDGVIDFADIPSFISVLQSSVFLDEADINGDGVVDFADIPFFIDLLIAQ